MSAPHSHLNNLVNVVNFCIISCNTCCQVDAHGHCCQQWALAWQYRKQNLLKELLSYKADILCLQASNLSLCSDLPCQSTASTDVYKAVTVFDKSDQGGRPEQDI